MQTYHLQNPMNQGFTRLELVCVTAVLGLLGAIALPSFFNKACACTGEAPTYVGSLARAQQAFFLDNGEFSSDLASLEMALPRETDNYIYDVTAQKSQAIAYAQSKNPDLSNYVSITFLTESETGQLQSSILVCKATLPGTEPIAQPVDVGTCGEGTELDFKSEPRDIADPKG